MIDTGLMQDYIREANPIPHVDDLDLDELAVFVAAAHTKRAAIMQAPTRHETTTAPTTPPPQRRRKVWAFAIAFVLILAAVGIAALALRNNNPPVADETDAEHPTPKLDVGPETFSDGWKPVADGQTWVQSIEDIDALPDGGFIVAAIDPWRLMWSPDGTEWFDADPQQQVSDPTSGFDEGVCPLFCGGPGQSGEPVVLAGTHALILNQAPPGVWVGNPREGTWELVSLDINGLVVPPRVLAVASSGAEAMVVAETSPRYFAAWLIDLASGASQWHPIPDPSVEQFDHDWVSVEWFNGRWMVTRDCQGCSTVYLSTDGSTWIESEIRWNADAAPLPEYWDDFRPGDGWRSATWDTATGPDAIVAAFFARPLAYSEDGLTWLALAPPRDSGEGGDDEGGGEWVALAYSDELGFVAVSPGGRFMQMENGQTWQYAGRWSEEIPGRAHLTASDSQMLLVRTEEHEAGVVSLWLWTSK